ncbi:glucans biosynthesis glucosyltransferase MdoH [Paroceanicella profunda]|nr:glucans biosynthesis glucosyltransferase MdoH [Paroceanicella profunda]
MDDVTHHGALGTSMAAVPPEQPLIMPTQSLHEAPKVRFRQASLLTWVARLITFGGAVALTVFGFQQMMLVFGGQVNSFLQGCLLVLFTVTFGWIALSASAALSSLMRFARRPKRAEGELTLRTALLMPVYSEDAATTCGALLAMGEMIAERGHGDDFEIFILSDTRDPETWLQETTAYAALREKLRGKINVWYRRREKNVAKKAGNLQEFVERWGARYDAMLVFDADSVMDPDTMIEMARRMQAAPNLGILQTVPMLCGGRTLFARLQQFAGCVYGAAIARGTAAWQGNDGNYWGHNALIRVRAFAENCGLPLLPGRLPFGGHVMSHDFVEAALIRRGGWDVRMDPDLEGSWEGSPPSLLDLSVRDRRWAQGNLQHIKVIGAAGLRWPNRAHFGIGIGSYLMSTIWLAMIIVGLALTGQALILQPQYFPQTFQMFPEWPVFDAERMWYLFALSLGMLLLPKALGLLSALLSTRKRRAMGGAIRLTVGALTEVLLSALYAPVLMLLQVSQVAEILMGRDSGWSAQSREGAAMPWSEAFTRHWKHMAIAIVPAIGLAYLAPEQLLWLSPVLVGLLLAAPLSRWSGSPEIGQGLKRLGLLCIPEERRAPEVLTRADSAREAFTPICEVHLRDLVARPGLSDSHAATLILRPQPRGEEHLARLTARAKIEAAESAEEAFSWLDRAETTAVLGSPDLLEALGRFKPA